MRFYAHAGVQLSLTVISHRAATWLSGSNLEDNSGAVGHLPAKESPARIPTLRSLTRECSRDRKARIRRAHSNGFRTGTSKREKSRTLRVTTLSSCTSAVAAIMASS